MRQFRAQGERGDVIIFNHVGLPGSNLSDEVSGTCPVLIRTYVQAEQNAGLWRCRPIIPPAATLSQFPAHVSDAQ